MMKLGNFSVLILTYNEEDNIGRCIDSIASCDDIVVLDSNSTDATVSIAQEKGARVHHRAFDNYAAQRNYGLNDIEFKHDWVFMLDADEVVPTELGREIHAALSTDSGRDVTMYRMRRKDFFLGRWIKYSSNYSSVWLGRLIRRGRVWVEREINEEYHTDGEIVSLEQALYHYPFNKGFHAWLEKHNRYSTMEAEFKFSQGQQEWRFQDFWHRDPTVRRKSLKAFLYALPGMPLILFFGRYLGAGGILDGRSGLTFCLLKAFYEYMISCKVKELALRQNDLPV